MTKRSPRHSRNLKRLVRLLAESTDRSYQDVWNTLINTGILSALKQNPTKTSEAIKLSPDEEEELLSAWREDRDERQEQEEEDTWPRRQPPRLVDPPEENFQTELDSPYWRDPKTFKEPTKEERAKITTVVLTMTHLEHHPEHEQTLPTNEEQERLRAARCLWGLIWHAGRFRQAPSEVGIDPVELADYLATGKVPDWVWRRFEKILGLPLGSARGEECPVCSRYPLRAI